MKKLEDLPLHSVFISTQSNFSTFANRYEIIEKTNLTTLLYNIDTQVKIRYVNDKFNDVILEYVNERC